MVPLGVIISEIHICSLHVANVGEIPKVAVIEHLHLVDRTKTKMDQRRGQ